MLLVSATNWTDSQHTSLLRCVRDHLDVPCLLLAVDELSLPELAPAIALLSYLAHVDTQLAAALATAIQHQQGMRALSRLPGSRDVQFLCEHLASCHPRCTRYLLPSTSQLI